MQHLHLQSHLPWFTIYLPTTADGRNPAPVDVVNILVFTGFHSSQVVQDFFHQEYVSFKGCRRTTRPPVDLDLLLVNMVKCSNQRHTVDGRNPANQLRLVVYPIIYRVSYMLGGCLGFRPPKTYRLPEKMVMQTTAITVDCTTSPSTLNTSKSFGD